ncbi:MAG: Extracellular ligand-binding receptor [Frankiales bacterium]|nr:Extracellular ligand-binding receptor [Frankiales bacterium]
MSRLGPSVDGSLSTLLVVAAGVVVLSFAALSGPAAQTGTVPGVAVGNSDSGVAATTTGGGVGPSGVATGGGPGGRTTAVGATVTTPGHAVAAAPAGISCAAGRNGGSTDRGVSGSEIKLGATIVSSGIGASFLGPVRVGMTAVKNDVNRSGGICGRQISLKMVDDGWDAQRGYTYIRNLVEGDKVFALAVNPSSEGLRIASNEGYFAKTRTPVVGTDGMLNSQYADPWIWPVAASTVSTMHIIAADAYNRNRARQFSIVYDSQYHFGVEGAFAFNAAVKRLTGKDIVGYSNGSNSSCSGRFCAIAAGKANYATENKQYNDACFGASRDNCDFVALLLEPTEALSFIRQGFGATFTAGMGLAQTLFSRPFATSCGSTCAGATVWTGYNPPIEALASSKAVSAYVNAVHQVQPDVDIYNQFLEGGYSGMLLTVEALKRAGAQLTRDRLAGVLDGMDYDNGLSTPLRWRPGNHYANVAMQPFEIQYQGSFNGFRSVGNGWVKDPWVGQDTPKEGR